ncbi:MULTISPECIES: Cof-type HAD-IIB family hydrolase [Kocuria]|uniref:HAD family hydrolase n=1 Tax=Kocuria subflava TaxID=1736139 RepID=A0A846U1R6_9MICC|nr:MULTISPECIES: Cof-type HAD-IIB family hydrolase [Kocuria]NKE08661.1 HAD family hydrolase [Kocuria subflava]
MTLKLVAVDMDGTFLDASSTYDHERFARIHQQLTDRGIQFVVASGNQYWQLKSHFPDVADILYVAENGAVVGTDSQILRVEAMQRQDALGALEVVSSFEDVHALACGVQAAYALETMDPDMQAILRKYYIKMDLVAQWSDVEDDIVKLALGCPPERTEELLEQIGQALPSTVVPVSSGHGSIDLIGRGVNKGTSLQWLCGQLGIDPADAMAFGDGGNDVEMLQLVGCGAVMANAPEAIKAVGDIVVGSHDQAGVLDHLETVLAAGSA